MTKADPTSFPLYNLDTGAVQDAFAKVGTAIANQDYRQAVEFTSQTLARIQDLLIVEVLDHRSYALGMQGHFDQAVSDAQKMITYGPTLATGYLRLGELYRMQGKQLSAIDIYGIGIQSVSEDQPDYAQLVDGKESATKQNETRVDFVARLPVEIVDGIISLLSSESKSISLTVSSTWRNQIFKCSNTWKSLTSNDNTGNDLITSVIPHIACHVEDLTIDTMDRRVFLRYLSGMSAGNFSKMKFLKLSENASKHISTIMIMSLANAFWHIQSSLSKLVLDLDQNSAPIALLDLLSVCSNLTCLEYTSASQLSSVIGELKPANSNDTLADMQLKAKSITKQDLQRLLPHCQQVRRLLLYGCDATVLEVADQICPKLEILGYNPENNAPVAKLNFSNAEHNSPGLYQFYTSNGKVSEPASTLLPLIRRNMHSLKTLYVCTDIDSPSNLNNLYSDLKLENLERLTFWGDDTGDIQPLLLRSISTCTMLTYLSVVCSMDIPGLVNALVDLPQLETFGLSHISSTVGETDLIRLLEVFARRSKSGQRQLRTMWLRYCTYIVNDSVLAALAGIGTLEDVTLEGLSSVSARGLAEFFKKLGNNVTRIKLAEFDAVTDSSLSAIGNTMKGLKTIYIGKLNKISDEGIIQLIEQLPYLEKLTLVNCDNVTQKAVAHVKKKVRNVVLTE